jgi:MFS family permease
VAPNVPLALLGGLLFGASAGMFLAVDWALMTDIIPKASAGRYMGLSNVATASAGVLAIAVGGSLMDFVGGPTGEGSGPRAALWLGVVLLGIGAALLWPVHEPPRGKATAVAPAPAAAV